MAKLLSCVLGPRLYRVHRPRLSGAAGGASAAAPGAPGGGGERGEPAWDSYYQPRGLEKHTDSVLALASVLWSISCYASPLAVLYLYRKGLLTMSRVVPLSHCAATLGLLLAGVACLRGLGRWSNPQYLEFMAVLEESHRTGSPESKRKLGLYAFDFRSWPPDFRWDSAGPAWSGTPGTPKTCLGTPKSPWGPQNHPGDPEIILGIPKTPWGPPKSPWGPQKPAWGPRNHPGDPEIILGSPKSSWGARNHPGEPETALGTPKPPWGARNHPGDPKNLPGEPQNHPGEPQNLIGDP